MTTEAPPKFLTLFWHSPDRANLCTLTLLAWISACDGIVAEEEEALIRRVAAAGNRDEVDAVLEVARLARIDDLEEACRYIMTRFPRKRKRLVAQLAITMAAQDGHITVGENQVLQFIADLLDIPPRTFAALFTEVTHRPFPRAGDPSSIDWWKQREAGVEAAPADDLPPEPAPHGPASTAPPTPDPFAQASSSAAPPPAPESAARMTRLRAMGILGVPSSAAAEEVRSAFRRLAKVRHPDRFAKLGPSAIAAATESFKQLEAAYAVLKGAT